MTQMVNKGNIPKGFNFNRALNIQILTGNFVWLTEFYQ